VTESLTRVEILFLPEFVNHWLRFGEADEWRDIDRRRAYAYFGPGRVFGYVRWEANEYGTKDWRFIVIQTVEPCRTISRVQGVNPGGKVLLHVKGNAQVKRALRQIDEIETAGIDPADVSPVYYRHVHNRILSRNDIRPYTPDQHEAHLAALKAGA
jgi:hypothetical protein